MASGGGPPTGGFGRGGRGLAILEALKKEQAQVPGQAPVLPGGGRGSLLAPSVTPQQQQHSRPLLGAQAQIGMQPAPVASQPQAAAAPRPALGGRGNLAGMLALVQQHQQQGGLVPGRGRGALLAAAAAAASETPPPPGGAPPVPAASAVPPSSQQRAAGEPTPPVGAMARMEIRGEVEPQAEHARGPAVSRRGAPGKAGGVPSKLAVNSIRLEATKGYVYQYHVSFSPVVDSKGMRVGLLNEHREVLPVKLFDGSIMYMPRNLPQDETLLTSIRKTDGAPITIHIKLTRIVPCQQCPQLYNILLRRIMSILNLVQVGRYFYNPAKPSKVPTQKMEVWPGYITSIREEEGGLLLLLDSHHKVLRCQTVLDLMAERSQKSPITFQQDITRQIVGCTVLTRYNNRTYRIDDIDWTRNPTNSFESSNGQMITFVDYYKTHYGKTVDPQQPLLIHRPKATKVNGQTVQPRTELLCLIPELCHLTGLTDDLRSNFSVMKDLGAHTRSTPNQRLAAMKTFVDSVNNSPEARQQLDNWGLRLDDSALAVEGRRMGMENIFFGGGKCVSAGEQADWNRELVRSRVITPVNIENWLIFYVRKNAADVTSFIQEAIRSSAPLGIQISMPAQVALPDDRTETLIKAIRESVNPTSQLVCVVMPTSREDKYSAIKKCTCKSVPVPSQVIVNRTISQKQKLKSVTQKIVLQMNCKLGGELWAINNPLGSAMVVGIDSFHDVSRGRNSIGGFVASTNPELTRWFSKVGIQMRGEELVPGLRLFMVSAIRKYYAMNHRRPEKIIVYRDGVGDSQMPIVKDYEVRQIVESFTDFGADYHPKLTVVIVQKRINTRIFLQGPKGYLDNPPPGTVLDHTVTRRDMYDYFIVSQHVRQGTVSPTHYVVVHDEINLTPDKMQLMTYKMTHLYYNWPGTVRVPAPCLYAHKLAYLVGENIHEEFSELLSDRLFFL